MSSRLALLTATLLTLVPGGFSRADDKDDAKAEIKKLAGDWYRSHGLSNGFVTTVQGFSLVMFFQDAQSLIPSDSRNHSPSRPLCPSASAARVATLRSKLVKNSRASGSSAPAVGQPLSCLSCRATH